MSANHRSWQEVTLLHDMAHEGSVEKARLLLDHGAEVDAIDGEYQSTPLGFAARWNRREVALLLIGRGADANRAARIGLGRSRGRKGRATRIWSSYCGPLGPSEARGLARCQDGVASPYAVTPSGRSFVMGHPVPTGPGRQSPRSLDPQRDRGVNSGGASRRNEARQEGD